VPTPTETPEAKPEAKNPLDAVFNLVTQHRQVVAERDGLKTRAEAAESKLTAAETQVSELQAKLSAAETDRDSLQSQLSVAQGERDAAVAASEELTEVKAKLTAAEIQVADLQAQVTTVAKGVQAELEKVGFDASLLPTPESTGADAGNAKAEALLARAEAVESTDAVRAIIEEAKAAGIDLVAYAKAKEQKKG
jgi:chromosome segregation ATPase